MIGFPMEEPEDLQALADLCRQALAVAKEVNLKRACMSASIPLFPNRTRLFNGKGNYPGRRVRKDCIWQKICSSRKVLKLNGIPADQSWLEGILARGDRRLAPVLMEAQRLGCRFDAWTEHARIGNWQQAFSACDVREDFYLRERREDELLPWDHIDVGVFTGISCGRTSPRLGGRANS